jgi:hypothetical protein
MRNFVLREARAQVADLLEEVGAVSHHLREAIDFAEHSGPLAASASVNDARWAIDKAIAELTKIRDKAGRWAVWAEGKEGGS